MKKLPLLFATLYFVIFSYAQTTGKPDLSFGNGGFAGYNPPSRAICVQSDGKIVAVGFGGENGVAGFIVARYNPDGSLDNSFDGNGKVASNFGLTSQTATSVVVQSDGKIVVAGYGSIPNPPQYYEIVARYNPDGSTDNSFNGNGRILIPSISDANSVAIANDGKIMLAGQYYLSRLKNNGTLDSTFGTNGRVYNRVQVFTFGVAYQNGKTVIAGFNNGEANNSTQNFGIARYNSNGSPDSSFDGNGVVSTALNGDAIAQSVIIQPDGKIIVSGSVGQPAPTYGYKYVIARYNVDGSLDNSFNGNGKIISDFAGKLALQPDGKILTAGANIIARYNTDGSPDNTFGLNGKAATTIAYSPSVAVNQNRFYVLAYAGALGAYQLGDTPQTGLYYKYYEGTWTSLPDFNSLTAVKSGNTPNIDISVRTPGRNDNYAFIWRGYINITTPGAYTFETVSDDGSKVYFNATYSADSIALVNNDGLHAPTPASGTVNIPAAGVYPITFTFFEKDGGEAMEIYWTGPGIARQPVPNSAFMSGQTTNPSTAGLNYKYYEGNFDVLPNFNTLTPVKTGNTANVDINVRPAGHDDHFAFVWEGYIKITTPGLYTFETVSDDGSKLYFNSLYNPSATPTVSNDGLHAPVSASASVGVAVAGVYPISITFFEKDGGENMEVYWSGPGIARQRIPDAAFTRNAPVSGLNYKYYEGTWTTLPEFNSLTPVKTGVSSTPDIGVRTPGRNDNFAFLWEGYITVPSPGNYTFELISDDGSKFYFNKFYSPSAVPLINNDGIHAPTSVTASVPAAGTYPIAITFFEKDGGETFQLYWSASAVPRQLVPASAFSLAYPAVNSGLKAEGGNINIGTATDLAASAITKIYPNPFAERFTVSFKNDKATDDISIAIYDLNGRQLYNQHAGRLPAGNTSVTVNLKGSAVKDGVYMVTISRNGVRSQVIKLIKQQ